MKQDRREFIKKAGWTFIGSGLYINLFTLDKALASSTCTGIRNLYAFIVNTETCIGCGNCVAACRTENNVPPDNYRTWVERYTILNSGDVEVDDPNGGEKGFDPAPFKKADIQKSFFVPKLCNHCTKPACVAACPRQAVYKREEDGIVLVDQNRCRGYRYCVKGCPYKKVYFNTEEKLSQKCIFCYPRLEKNPVEQNFCFTQCVGRIRYVGYNTNAQANVNKLVDDWKVAMLLFPEFGTEPNLYYIPPMSPPQSNGTERVPTDYLADLFGDNKDQKHKARKARIEEIFNILETERAKVAAGGTSELIDILIAKSEDDRLQLNLG